MLAVRKKGDKPVLLEVPDPIRKEGEALLRVDLAGICATDLEILEGYMNFEGTLGHEFVGTVLEASRGTIVGKRVVGGINCGCRECPLCLSGDPRHCPDRTVLGIFERDGAFAEQVTLHEENLVQVPDSVPDEVAVFTEPVAAALEITEQVEIRHGDPVLVMGDGRLGTITAIVLREAGAQVIISGRTPEKINRLEALEFDILPGNSRHRFSTVVEATGSPAAIAEAIEKTTPRGHIILKTTSHEASALNLSRVVVDEITIVGSRCGPMKKAVEFLSNKSIDTQGLISGIFALEDAAEAFRTASLPGSLKILLKP